jgi:hypothetical protein
MMAEAAKAQYWDATADDQFARYERRQRLAGHFADILKRRQAEVLGVIAGVCWDRGCCALSVDGLANEALVSRRTVYNALRSAREPGLIREGGGLIRMAGPKWQAMLREEEGRGLR